MLTLFCIGIIRFFTLSQRLLYAYKSGVVDLGAIILYYLMLFQSKSIGRPLFCPWEEKKQVVVVTNTCFFNSPLGEQIALVLADDKYSKRVKDHPRS